MRAMMDFSSWQGIMTTLAGILMFTLIAMGVRILMMLTFQARQSRMNRQINERLRTLIAAYRVLGGSFTGRLTVDPSHLGSKRAETEVTVEDSPQLPSFVLERRVQIRDAVEGALSDILLLGTEEHVRLAGKAAQDMAAGQPIHTAELVVSLRRYIRTALDLKDVPEDVVIPAQGPTRPAAGGGRGRGGGEGRSGGGGGGAGGGGGMGMGMGLGMSRRGEEGS